MTIESILEKEAIREVEHDVAMPRRLLVFKEKHGTRYYYAGTPEATYNAALSVLNDRFGVTRPWFDVEQELERLRKHPPAPPYPANFDVKTLPEALRMEAKKQMLRHDQAVRAWKQEEAMLVRIQQALKQQDARLAYLALYLNRDGEYEGMEFRYLSNIPAEVLAAKSKSLTKARRKKKA